MAAISGPIHLGRRLPPMAAGDESKVQKRFNEFLEYTKKDPTIFRRAPLRIYMLDDDFETFRKRFEKLPEGLDVMGPMTIKFATFAVIFITVAGVTYAMIKVYQATHSKL